MSSAAQALQAAAMAALGGLSGCRVQEGAPVQAALPSALVEIGSETDWGHKSGRGRELRLAVVIRDAGERPSRLMRLMGEAEAALERMPSMTDGWRIVTLAMTRSRMVPPGRGAQARNWAGVIEYRARMLAA
jgi:hypothetical protein